MNPSAAHLSGLISRAPEPTRVPPAQPQPPTQSWAVRGVAALLNGRLPYQLRDPVDRVMRRAGSRYRRLTLGEYRVVVRRNAPWDEASARRVIENKDYDR